MMKSMKLSLAIALLTFLSASLSKAADIDLTKDFDSLGGNEAILERAKALDPKNRVRIVQNRIVDRENRLELGMNYGGVAGGQSYLNTSNYGAQADFHLTPRWSVGARYYSYLNSLTNEGERVFADAQQELANGGDYDDVPSIDYPKESVLGVINWYPMYGKLNFLDLAVTQFDLFLLAGGGSMHLSSGWTETYTAGGGMGFWWTQHLSTRLEARWQTYADQSYRGSERYNLTVATITMGFLL
jgi:outer membrane immunogenic protein